jgi:hypothetical protein
MLKARPTLSFNLLLKLQMSISFTCLFSCPMQTQWKNCRRDAGAKELKIDWLPLINR